MYCGVPEEDPDKLVALVLSGGKSVRMGQDKGSLLLDGKPWIERASELCATENLSVFYSIQSEQKDLYASFLNADLFILDSVEVKGPLAGLLSFYLKHPNTDVLLMPCDMIAMSNHVLKSLVDTYETMSIGHDLIIYQYEDGTVEPMPGIYTSEALRKIYWLFASGDLLKHSLKYCIEISNTFMLPIKSSEIVFFKNANTPDDIIK